MTLVKGGLGRIGQTGLEALLVRDGQPIDQQFDPFGLVGLQEGESLVDPVGFPIDLHPGEALLLQEVQLFRKSPSLRQLDGSQEGEAGAYGVGKHIPHNVGHLMLLHLLARDGGDGLPDAGKEQTQILVNFGRGADGRARVAGVDPLFDGNGRRNALDEVTFGLAHASEKLSGIGRQALHIPSLAFGIERVERQG